MKTADDFRRVLGEGDKGFQRRVQATLAALPKEETIMKRKVSAGLIVAFALLMMTIAAMAAGWWGLVEFLKNDRLQGMTREVGVSTETEHATFTVTEHIYDGRGIYLVVAVRPKEEGVMLLPQGMDEDAWMEMLVPGSGNLTVKEYAEQQGYTGYVWVAVNTDPNVNRSSPYFSRREHLETDGTLLLMLSNVGEQLPGELPLTLVCGSRDIFIGDSNAWQDTPRVSKGQMNLSLCAHAAAETRWRSREPIVFDELNMTVDEIRLVQTPLAVYYEIDYTSHNPAANMRDDSRTPGYVFRFAGADGKALPPSGVALQTRYVLLDEETGRGRWIGTLAPDSALTDAISLKGILGDFARYDATQTKLIPLVSAD